MDQRLTSAARSGDVDAIYTSIEQDPFVLEKIDKVPFSETPLHAAVLARKTRFAKEIACLRPSLASKLDQNGYSPIHLASATGQVEIVRELSKSDPKLSLLKGREMRIPLLCAAMTGSTGVISLLLESSPNCLLELTSRKETAFHLAVKNNQLEAFKVLLGWFKKLHENEIYFSALQLAQDQQKAPVLSHLFRGVKLLEGEELKTMVCSFAFTKSEREQFQAIQDSLKKVKKVEILNWKDDEGNTVLHLAASGKQIQMIDELLRYTRETETYLDVNALNATNLTALDILRQLPRERGHDELENILRRAGTVSSIQIVTTFPLELSSKAVPVESICLKRSPASPDHSRTGLLIAAMLIALTCFMLGVSPPGGVWKENYTPGSNTTEVAHKAGTAVLASKSGLYNSFMTFDIAGFFISLVVVSTTLRGSPARWILLVALAPLLVAYVLALALVTPSKKTSTVLSLYLSFLGMFISAHINEACALYWRRRRGSRRRG